MNSKYNLEENFTEGRENKNQNKLEIAVCELLCRHVRALFGRKLITGSLKLP